MTCERAVPGPDPPREYSIPQRLLALALAAVFFVATLPRILLALSRCVDWTLDPVLAVARPSSDRLGHYYGWFPARHVTICMQFTPSRRLVPVVAIQRLIVRLLYSYIRTFEESEMAERFGLEYESYRRQVPFLIPSQARLLSQGLAARIA